MPPEIFKALKKLTPGKGGEIWLVDAINNLQKQGVPLYTVLIKDAKYYDTGNKLEYMKTVVDMALHHKEISKVFKDYLKKLTLD